jgi:hypothetical protein
MNNPQGIGATEVKTAAVPIFDCNDAVWRDCPAFEGSPIRQMYHLVHPPSGNQTDSHGHLLLHMRWEIFKPKHQTCVRTEEANGPRG